MACHWAQGDRCHSRRRPRWSCHGARRHVIGEGGGVNVQECNVIHVDSVFLRSAIFLRSLLPSFSVLSGRLDSCCSLQSLPSPRSQNRKAENYEKYLTTLPDLMDRKWHESVESVQIRYFMGSVSDVMAWIRMGALPWCPRAAGRRSASTWSSRMAWN